MKWLTILLLLTAFVAVALCDTQNLSLTADDGHDLPANRVYVYLVTLAGTGEIIVDSLCLWHNDNGGQDTLYFCAYTNGSGNNPTTLLGNSTTFINSGGTGSSTKRILPMQAPGGGDLSLTGGTSYYFGMQCRKTGTSGGTVSVLTAGSGTYRAYFTDAGTFESTAPSPTVINGASHPKGYIVYHVASNPLRLIRMQMEESETE